MTIPDIASSPVLACIHDLGLVGSVPVTRYSQLLPAAPRFTRRERRAVRSTNPNGHLRVGGNTAAAVALGVARGTGSYIPAPRARMSPSRAPAWSTHPKRPPRSHGRRTALRCAALAGMRRVHRPVAICLRILSDRERAGRTHQFAGAVHPRCIPTWTCGKPPRQGGYTRMFGEADVCSPAVACRGPVDCCNGGWIGRRRARRGQAFDHRLTGPEAQMRSSSFHRPFRHLYNLHVLLAASRSVHWTITRSS